MELEAQLKRMLNPMHNKQAHKTLSSGVPKMIIGRNLHTEDSVQRGLEPQAKEKYIWNGLFRWA